MKNTEKESEQMRFAILMRNFTKIHLPVHRRMSDETIRAYKASMNAFRCLLFAGRKRHSFYESLF